MIPCWGCVDLGAMLDPSWAMLGPCWGYVELCWDHVGSCSVKIGAILGLNGSMLAHFEALLGLCWSIWGLCWGQVRPSRAMLGLWQTARPDFVSKTLLLPGTGITKMPPEQVYVGLSWGMLGPCSPILGLCWGFVDPRSTSSSREALFLVPNSAQLSFRADWPAASAASAALSRIHLLLHRCTPASTYCRTGYYFLFAVIFTNSIQTQTYPQTTLQGDVGGGGQNKAFEGLWKCNF